jgi:hypothetical protein
MKDEEKEMIPLPATPEKQAVQGKKRGPKPKGNIPKPSNIQARLEADIRMFLSTLSILAASQAGEIWDIKEDEICLISKPLSSILERMNISQTSGKYMDFVTLFTGLSIILIPRIIEQRKVNEVKKNEGKNSRNDKKSIERPATDGT